MFESDLSNVRTPRHAARQRKHLLHRNMQTIALHTLGLTDFLLDPTFHHVLQRREQRRVAGVDAVSQNVDIQKVLFAIAGGTEFDCRKHIDAGVNAAGLGFGNAQ